MLSAQASPQGVPKELLEAKKLELMQEKVGVLLHHCIGSGCAKAWADNMTETDGGGQGCRRGPSAARGI
jgi:hypothetical protein